MESSLSSGMSVGFLQLAPFGCVHMACKEGQWGNLSENKEQEYPNGGICQVLAYALLGTSSHLLNHDAMLYVPFESSCTGT